LAPRRRFCGASDNDERVDGRGDVFVAVENEFIERLCRSNFSQQRDGRGKISVFKHLLRGHVKESVEIDQEGVDLNKRTIRFGEGRDKFIKIGVEPRSEMFDSHFMIFLSYKSSIIVDYYCRLLLSIIIAN
jgi:hypothetical protein